MPFDGLFRKEAANAANLAQIAAEGIREEIVEVRTELELFDSPQWQMIEDMLEEESQKAFSAMMATDDPNAILFARERARVVNQLRAKPRELRQKLEGLQKQATELEGEIDG